VEVVDCATAALCVDQVEVLNGPTSDVGAYLGSLAGGFRSMLAPPSTPGQPTVACSASACWLATDPVPSGGGITLTEASASGTARLTLPLPPSGLLAELTCTPTICLALERYGPDQRGRTLPPGAVVTPIALPSGIGLDDPVLLCTVGSSECLMTLDNREVVRVSPSAGRLGLDARVTLDGQGLEPPTPSALVAYHASLCHKAFDTTDAIALATFAPRRARPTSLVTLADPAAGLGLLVPQALDCPSATSCDLVAELGTGPSALLEATLARHRVTVVPVAQGASVEGLACASATRCVLALSGSSQHHGIPTLAIDGNRVVASALLGTAEELSSLAVASTRGGDCVALATRAVGAGGTIVRPVDAMSSDAGRIWRIAGLRGLHIPTTEEPGVSTVPCTRARCVGI